MESFCREDISNAELTVGGFELVCRRDGRDTAMGRGRGLLVYVREGIAASELQLEGGTLSQNVVEFLYLGERGGGRMSS